jgi:hypothetical protein
MRDDARGNNSPWLPGSLVFSPDGRRILSGSNDRTIKLWNAETGELIATFFGGDDDDWLVMTPEGFFAASEQSTISAVRGTKAYSIDRVYQSLYRPDLVREKLAGDPRGLVREAATRVDLNKVLASGNAPVVTIALPRDRARPSGEQVRAEVEVTDKGGGIGRIEWRVNGLFSYG